ncbi:hypothetical protein KY326_03370, partial [Candidatus Woesearchaeota archaeon]|nr:hypothetical protein [Candidatus Woesearchaeota archaeon]
MTEEEKKPDGEKKEGIDKLVEKQLVKKKPQLVPSVSDAEMKAIMENIRKKAAEKKAQQKTEKKPMFEFKHPEVAEKIEPKVEIIPEIVSERKSSIEAYNIEPKYEAKKAEEKVPSKTSQPPEEPIVFELPKKQEAPEESSRIFKARKHKEEVEKEFVEKVRKLEEKQQVIHKREKPELVSDKVLVKRIHTTYRRFSSIFLVIAVLLVISTFIFIKLPDLDITGKAVAEPATYLEINRYITEDTVIPIILESNKTQLTSLGITGRFLGDGRLRIYLESKDDRILVADSYKMRTEIEPANATVELDDINYINDIDLDTNSDKVQIKLEYNEGSQWDPEDDGVEFAQNAIDFTVKNSIVPVDRTKLCTRWVVNEHPDTSVCYGNNDCCNFLGLSSANISWEAPFHLHAGMENVGKENHVKARILNLDLDDESNTIYTREAALPARFYSQLYEFTDYCEGSCNISSEFTGNYNLSIEIIGDIYFDLFGINYTTVTLDQKVEEVTKDIPTIILSDQEDWAGDYSL